MRALPLSLATLLLGACWAPAESLELDGAETLAVAQPGTLPQVPDALAPYTFVGIEAGGGTLAVWTDRIVYARHEGEALFSTAARTTADIRAVTLMDDGTTVVLDDSGTLTIGGLHRVLPANPDHTVALRARGRRIAWLGTDEHETSTLKLSEDRGLTWRELPVPEDCTETNDLGLFEGGRLDFFGGCEAGCGGGYQFRYALTLPDEAWEDVEWTIDSPVHRFVGNHGWAYGLGACGGDGGAYERGLCALSSTRTVRIMATPTEPMESFPDLRAGTSNARMDAMVLGDTLLTVADGTLKRRARMHLPGDVDLDLALDDENRLFALVDGTPTRWDEGWHPLDVRTR